MEELFKPVNIKSLKTILNMYSKTYANNFEGLLFCFGTSFISKLIQAKTRLFVSEDVPSHVAMIKNDFIFESTTEEVKVHGKSINGGVRRWLIDDFYAAEKKKKTRYVLFPLKLDEATLEAHVHKPYGKDAIVDYLLKDKSKGSKNGLICSQYANLCCSLICEPCCTPAELFRMVKQEYYLKHETKRGDDNVV